MVVCEPLFCFAQSQRLQQRTLDPGLGLLHSLGAYSPIAQLLKNVVVREGPAQRH
jgi:hypothetical protein